MRLATRNRYFKHPEEKPGFVLPESCLIPISQLEKKADLESNASGDEWVDESEHSPANVARLAPEGTILVDWYGPNDPANPQNWNLGKKVWATFVIMYYSMAVYAGSAIVAYATHEVSEYFRVSEIVATLTLTLFVVGYAIGPLFLSPLSEVAAIGRNPPYVFSLIIFCVLQIPAALSTNFAALLVIRFLSGFAGSPPLATGGATITDIFTPRKSGYAMGAFGVALGVAPALAPLLTGFTVMHLGWRWAFWVLLMMSGAGLVLLFFGLPETSADNILYRRAARLRALTGNKNLRSAAEVIDRTKTISGRTKEALIRPLEMTLFEPIVLAIDVYQGLTYMILYSYFESFPLVFANAEGGGYGWNMGLAGLPFLALTIGGLVSWAIYCWWSWKYWEPNFVARNGHVTPESYLTLSLFGSFCYPVCLLWFGWSANRTHWISPVIASGVFGLADCWSFMPYLSYLAAAYPKYAASALASNDFVRSIMGAAMPIVARPLFLNLGIDWGNTIIGVAAALFIPLPFLLLKYGPWLRARSPRATHFECPKLKPKAVA